MVLPMPTPGTVLGPRLQTLQAEIRSGCSECGRCVVECGFLQRHGNPRQISDRLTEGLAESLPVAFDCSLCGLCTEVCPQKLGLAEFFLELRREAVQRQCGEFATHRPLTRYEDLGTSRRFTLYRLPEACTTIFFPGCALSGTRPAGVNRIFARLRQDDPQLGIVFDCCLKPSHSLGRAAYVADRFTELRERLRSRGVEEVLVACPNCQVMFNQFGAGIKVRSVWEVLADTGLQPPAASGPVTVHDPCVNRHANATQTAVRTLLQRQGLTVEEMPHSRVSTVCCGKGGGVDLHRPELAGGWRNLRRKEAAGRRTISYCAGCVQSLSTQTPTSHLVDLLFEPEAALAGRLRGAKAPLTYLNRLRLKHRYQRLPEVAMCRERASRCAPESSASGRPPRIRALLLLALLVAAVAAVHLTGLAAALRQERLQQLIEGYGMLAPLAYMLIYALAPVLFLPGLPITIAGGLLFGPLWGVVYTMLGATTGAALAFLSARYLARDWVAGKLTGPAWQKLDHEVAEHGWKVVAVTRLIPAFPFNLLNYALGLTKIPFAHYLAATFVCMLPACIAYVVFSSSLLDLLRGSLSPRVYLGVVLVALVSLVPFAARRLRAARENIG